jgi:hypothetical protein
MRTVVARELGRDCSRPAVMPQDRWADRCRLGINQDLRACKGRERNRHRPYGRQVRNRLAESLPPEVGVDLRPPIGRERVCDWHLCACRHLAIKVDETGAQARAAKVDREHHSHDHT